MTENIELFAADSAMDFRFGVRDPEPFENRSDEHGIAQQARTYDEDAAD
jgi:hypothetical protein